MLKIKLLACDYDGTLANADREVSEENKNAIRRFTEQGGVFALVSGRAYFSAKPICQRLNLQGVVVTAQGSAIYDIATGECLHLAVLSPARAIGILQAVEALSAPHVAHIYTEEGAYTAYENEYTAHYRKITRTEVQAIGRPLKDFVAEKQCAVQKILVFIDPKETEEVDGALKPALTQNGAEGFTSEPFFYEIISNQAGKGRGLLYLAERFSVPLSQTAAVGDGQNDVSMLLATPNSFAVQNANPKLKAVAKTVLPKTNIENAVSYLIENYCMGE